VEPLKWEAENRVEQRVEEEEEVEMIIEKSQQ
jgi:hypothetical protein